MTRVRVTTPVPDYSGSVGGVSFAAGVAVVDEDTHPAEMAYFRSRGYGIEPEPEAQEPSRPARRSTKESDR